MYKGFKLVFCVFRAVWWSLWFERLSADYGKKFPLGPVVEPYNCVRTARYFAVLNVW